jgi:hypothetical protein
VPERAEHGRAMPPPGGVGKRVLLAEDNLINQRIGVGYLRKARYRSTPRSTMSRRWRRFGQPTTTSC